MPISYARIKYEWGPYLKKAPVAVAAIVLVAAVILLVTCFYAVPADSEGVVLRLGKYHLTTGPGLHAKLPWPIDSVIKVEVLQVKALEFGFRTARPGKVTVYASPTKELKEQSLMLTGDLNVAVVEWIIQYQVKDSRDFLFNVEDVPVTIRDVSETVMRRLVGERSVDEVITTGREVLGAEAREQTAKLLDEYGCGIRIVALRLQDATPPESVKKAFDEVNKARQDQQRIINEAEATRNKPIPEARGKRQLKILEAEGYYERRVKEATGDANALLSKWETFKDARDETRLRLYLETMESIFRNTRNKIIVDEELKGVLPLLQLGKGGGQ